MTDREKKQSPKPEPSYDPAVDYFTEIGIPPDAIPALLEKLSDKSTWLHWTTVANEWLRDNGRPEIIPKGFPTSSPREYYPEHSDDFRSVVWLNSTSYYFSLGQAVCVEILWQHWERGTPDVSAGYILEKSGLECKRFASMFRVKGTYHPAWGAMIIPGKTKGTYRLAGEPFHLVFSKKHRLSHR